MGQQGLAIVGDWSLILALLAVLAVAMYTDMRWRRLPNWLTLGGAALGLGAQLATGGLAGVKDGLLGWLVGCGLLLLPFMLKGMGAGDVKLLAAVGAFTGPASVVVAAFYMAVTGGVLALGLLALRGELLPLLRNLGGMIWFALRTVARFRILPPLSSLSLRLVGEAGAISAPGARKATTLPYGVAIAIGSVLALAMGY